MSSTKSSEESSDEEIEVSEEEIKALSSQLESDPFLYDVHVQLIKLLQKSGDLDRLREAREKMASLFPLTPDWIKDESSLLLEGADRSSVEDLFHRAVADYQSVDVWLEYCQFAIGGMGSGEPERVAAVRAVFEQALANQGLNFAKGAVLWEIYREFETILLAQVQASSTDPEALNAQLKIIDGVFRRQLRVAHQDMQATLEEYKDFLAGLGAPLLTGGGGGTEAAIELKDGVPADCAADFSRASAKATACQPYEDAVADAEDDEEDKLLTAWETYLDWAVANCSQKATKSVVQKRSSAAADATPPPPLTPFENDPEALNAQLKIIDGVFRRQLRVAHQDMQATLEEYKDFLAGLGAPLLTGGGGGTEAAIELKDGVPADCAADFSRASAKATACQPYEDAVADAEDDEEDKLLTAWETYLDWAVANCSQKATKSVVQKRSSAAADATPPPPLTPFEVICLFERAITALCLHPAVWLKAADFLETHVSADTERLFKLLARSVRNVLWSGALWRRYALASEAQALQEVADLNGTVAAVESSAQESALTKALKRPEAIYETALKCGFADPAELRLVWTAYGDFWLRRLLHASDGIGGGEMKEQWILDNLRSTFERAIDHLFAAFGDNGDPDCSLPRYWAFIESKYAGDSGRAQGLWTRMLKMNNNGSKPAFWLSYLDFEKNLGDLKHLLRVASMAINSVTGPLAEPVLEAALRSLAELGLDLQRLREFEVKVRARRVHLGLTSGKAPASGGGGGGDDMLSETPGAQQSKKPKGGRAPATTDQRQQDRSHTAKRKSDARGAPDLKQPPSKRSKEDVEVGEDAGKPEAPNGSRPRHGETVTHDPSKDDRTVFVSNLPFKATETDLQRVFEPCGQIASVRLVRDFAGRSKGFAYVEFTTPGEPVAAALAMDRQPLTPAADTAAASDSSTKPLQGRPMFVSVCQPNRSESKQFAHSTGVPEPKKLFVRNLEKHVSEAALRTLFSQHGTVTTVRLVTFRNGMPKGHAYVEFATEEEASRALTATDGLTVGNKQISVAISNPPRKAEPHASGAASHFGGSKGGSKTGNLSGPPRSHAESHLAFMPRALNRGSAVLPAGAEVPRPPPTDETPKSNADFRKLFLKD
ncbi:Squamous cell carcinoma antigen recognized by T-cells 3 [Sparganum proliferum]